MVVKPYGFDWPPVAVIDILKQCSIPQDSIFYVIDPFMGAELPYDEIQNTEKNNLYVIIMTHEGASHHWFDRLIPKLITECGVVASQIILYSSCIKDKESPISHVGSIVEYASTMIERFPSVIDLHAGAVTHHFVCMNRMHRWQRLGIVKLLLDRDLAKYGCISYTDISSLPNDQYRRHFPMTVDFDRPTLNQGYVVDTPALTNAMYNIITESCYEREPGKSNYESHPCPGFTEKTFKSMMMAQLPIWVAPRYTVTCFRELGFDAFDDLVDHSYDLESDPVRRLSMIADEIQRCTQLPLDTLDRLRQDLLPRFQDNWTRLRGFYKNWAVDLQQFQRLFQNLGKIDL